MLKVILKLKLWWLLILTLSTNACGFHLRGLAGDYRFSYHKVYLDCEHAVICPGLRNTIVSENLTALVNKPESAEVTLKVYNEETSRQAYAYNSVGQVSGYNLTYQITAKLIDKDGEEIGTPVLVSRQTQMVYNNSLILSGQVQEQNSWNDLHEEVINELIRRIVYTSTKTNLESNNN